MFGDVPLIITTDYKTNAVAPRSSIDDVYKLIEEDLLLARELLSETYPSGEKVRANTFSASALLARVYLYQGKWVEAEQSAGMVVASDKYTLDTLPKAFLANSDEGILQFYPVSRNQNTYEGFNFILTTAPPTNIAFTDEFITSFEPGDLRRDTWLGEIADASS